MKKIAIIGGGISGLSYLHFFKKKFGNSVQVYLFEKNEKLGGWIQTKKISPDLSNSYSKLLLYI